MKHDHRSEPSTASEDITGVVATTGVACFIIGTGVGACFSTPYIFLKVTG